MLRISLLLILFSHRIPAYVTDHPSFADRLDQLYEKLEKFTVAPDKNGQILDSEEKLYAKLDRLNSLSPEKELSDDDEELLSAMQLWGMLSADQLAGVVKDLQGMKRDEVEKNERLTDGEYSDGEWIDGFQDLQYLAEGDYPMDGNEDWDDVDPDSSTAKTLVVGVTPSAFTRTESVFRNQVVSAVDSIAATNERPRILDDSTLSPMERSDVRQAALRHIGSVVRSSKCLTPQQRWLSVRQLAPAADTVYMPPCVQLYRCAPDSGCCYNEAEVCAPVEGKYVTMPFYLNKADGNFTVARMVFYNHTRCGCVSRDTLQSTVRARVEHAVVRSVMPDIVQESQADWRSTEEPRLERDEEPNAPELRRCTCPGLFMARISETGVCSCTCDWPEPSHRRDCSSLSRGREHFGMRDRVCVAEGDCTPPTCEYGAYERSQGRCPLRRYRRIRYHRGRFGKTVV